MNTTAILHFMQSAPFAIYAVDMTQTIVFWNSSAEQILGHKSREVVGRKCYEVCNTLPEAGLEPICIQGCPSITLARAGQIPSIANPRIRCASGERKLVTVTPLVIPLNGRHRDNIMIHILSQQNNHSQEQSNSLANGIANVLTQQGSHSDEVAMLTSREREVLRLVALRQEPARIAVELNISSHTVLNHIRNARTKLHAANRMEAVLLAIVHDML